MLLWLWCRPAAVTLIRPLTWKPPYAAGAALKIQKKERKKGKEGRKEGRREGRKEEKKLTFEQCLGARGIQPIIWGKSYPDRILQTENTVRVKAKSKEANTFGARWEKRKP